MEFTLATGKLPPPPQAEALLCFLLSCISPCFSNHFLVRHRHASANMRACTYVRRVYVSVCICVYLEKLQHEIMASTYICACELAESSPIKRGLCV